jgi:hypothetical protein
VPVSGMVLTLSGDAELSAAARAAVQAHPSIQAGEAAGPRLPIVVDTATQEQTEAVWEWLHGLEGVRFVDLVCADSSEDAGGNRHDD